LGDRSIKFNTTMDTVIYKIAKEFGVTTGPRFIHEGENSGEKLRTQYFFPFLKKAIAENKLVVVDLDGVVGYGTSFLEETFGGLIRYEGLSHDMVKKHLKFVSDEEPYLIADINHYIANAKEAPMAAV
jgi:hypothetical protein